MKRITAEYDYLQGFLRYGHMELTLDDETYHKEFEPLSEEEKKDYLEDCGHLVLDSYRIEDRGKLGDIEVSDIES